MVLPLNFNVFTVELHTLMCTTEWEHTAWNGLLILYHCCPILHGESQLMLLLWLTASLPLQGLLFKGLLKLSKDYLKKTVRILPCKY